MLNFKLIQGVTLKSSYKNLQILDLFLWYPQGSKIELLWYSDVDYASLLIVRKDTSSMAHFLGSWSISCESKKLNIDSYPQWKLYIVIVAHSAQLL